jgi:hypothetical protein
VNSCLPSLCGEGDALSQLIRDQLIDQKQGSTAAVNASSTLFATIPSPKRVDFATVW